MRQVCGRDKRQDQDPSVFQQLGLNLMRGMLACLGNAGAVSGATLSKLTQSLGGPNFRPLHRVHDYGQAIEQQECC